MPNLMGIAFLIAVIVLPPAVLGVVATTREGHHIPGGTR